eukprot:gene54450-72761_t
MHALDSHFLSAAPIEPASPAAAADAVLALRKLQALLAEFNGDSTDYFDSARPALATLLSSATMDRLAGHMAHYDFAAANQLLTARQTILIRELFAQFQASNPVTDAEVQAEYDRFKGQASGTEYRARHILVEKEDEAKAIIASLKKGGKFDDIAKKQSKDPGSGANGGDLDWATPSSFPKVFSDAFVALQKGQVTEKAVQTPNGFHVIKVDDVREAKLPTLDEVKPQISDALTQKKLQAYQEELVKKAK